MRIRPLYAPEGTGSSTGTENPPPADAWHKGLDAETVGFWQNKGYDLTDPKTLALKVTEQYRALERHQGVPPERLIRLPERPDDTEGWRGVFERLGRPKEAKDYDLSGVKFADGTELEGSFLDSMRAALHGANVPKDAASGIVKAVVKYLDDADAADAAIRVTKQNEEKEALKKNWGTAFEYNHLKAIEGARRLGIAPEAVKLMEGQVGYAALMEAMRKIGVGTTEATFVPSGGPGGPGTVTTREGAIARRAELMADAEWSKRYLAGGVKEKQEMDGLIFMIDGEAA